MSPVRRIAITTSSFAEFSSEPLDLLVSHNVAYVRNSTGRALAAGETEALLAGCQGVVAGTEPYDAALLDALPELRCISRCGAGMDSVDLAAAAARDVKVVNTPDGPTRAVAELTLGLALNLVRHIGEMDKEMQAGSWKKKMGSLMQGMTVGIVGLGRIGRTSAALFKGLGCEVVFHDPFVGEAAGYVSLSLPELLASARLVCLHCPAREDKRPVIGGAELRLMPRGSWLINTARGGLVDEEALLEALESGHIAGAALDVFSGEPYSGPLASHPGAITTPHVGSYAREARTLMELDAVKNLLQALGW